MNILAKMLGSVIKNQVGTGGLIYMIGETGRKMISPAVMATKVSSTTTRADSPSRECSLPI